MRLSHQDLTSVLDAVGILTADSEPSTLPSRANDAVKSLVSTDILSFEGFGSDNDYQGPLWYTPAGTVSSELLEIMANRMPEHPCFEDIARRRIKDAVRVSNYLPISKFKETAIFNEFFRQIGTDRQLIAGLPVNANLMISVSLCRVRKEFTDRDCTIFDLLTPHLVSAFRNAQFINRLKFESEQFQLALESTRLGIVTIDDELKIQVKSPTAIALIRKYFQSKSDLLPDELNRYIGHSLPKLDGDEFYLPPAPLEISKLHGRLKIRLTFNSTMKITILHLEEFLVPPIASLIGRQLTRREESVLFWITQGKTDGEIGMLLEISVRTVQKHVEHIFDKLGVETRTAAAMTRVGPHGL
jgi:DNA-binding CsgD family transcriptional regulator